MALEDIYNFLKYDDTFASAGQPTEIQLAEVAQAGFQVVINLALHDAGYALPDESATVATLGMEYIHIPVIWTAPQLQDLAAFFQAMESARDKKVFVHCAANMRATAFIALYRIHRLSWQPEEAFAVMRQIWTPYEVWEAFVSQALEQTHL